MSARAVLEELHGAGLALELIDDKIMVGPTARLTDSMRAAIRAHRAELVDALMPEAALAPAPAPTAPSARIYRLTRSQADEAHREAWGANTIEAFILRRDALLGRGYDPDDADDLAELLTLRDSRSDEARMCVECTYLGERGRCLAAAAGRLPGANPRMEPVATNLMRCVAFGLRKGWP